MRVLQVSGSFPPQPCGIGDYCARLAEALAEDGTDTVGVLAPHDAGALAGAGVQVLRQARGWRLAELPALLRTIRAWRPDVVHLHYPSQGFGRQWAPTLLPLACRLTGLRVVQTWHEPWPLLAAPRLLLQRAGTHGLVFVRPNLCALMPPLLRPLLAGCPHSTIASAAALPVSHMDAGAREALRARYLQGKATLVVFFGFLYPSKGVHQLFEIARPDRHALVIAGTTSDPGYQATLDSAAAAHGWAGQVQYTGFLPAADAADLIAAADAVVLPFADGGGHWNTSIHAALAQGTLVVTTSTAPAGDEPARNLFTALPGDVAAMAQAVATLAGRRAPPAEPGAEWARIAQAHRALYAQLH